MSQPQIIDFGPVRVVGFSYIGANKNNEIPTMWEKQILPRAQEVCRGKQVPAFGACRCVPNAKPEDGHIFEYIGGFQADGDMVIPPGMVEIFLPQSQYVAIEVPSLKDIPAAWQSTGKVMADLPQWQTYCNENYCRCADHPGFEYYPTDFCTTGRLYIYVPITKKTA